MQAMRNHITNLKAEIRSEVQATLQNQINSLKGEFKNELKTQHNLFVNQQNDFQNNLQNITVEVVSSKTKVQPSTSTSMVPTIILPSNTITNPRCEVRGVGGRGGRGTSNYFRVGDTPLTTNSTTHHYDVLMNALNCEKETELTKEKGVSKSFEKLGDPCSITSFLVLLFDNIDNHLSLAEKLQVSTQAPV
ncbi:hypothetical protein Tco_0011741 [Tanacetum coccineum]